MCCTWAGRSACSTGNSVGPCASAMGIASSLAVTCRPRTALPITCTTGSTAGPPTSTTGPCCARSITGWSTTTTSTSTVTPIVAGSSRCVLTVRRSPASETGPSWPADDHPHRGPMRACSTDLGRRPASRRSRCSPRSRRRREWQGCGAASIPHERRGQRNELAGLELEFRHAGEAHVARPADITDISDEAFEQFFFIRQNPKGIVFERWRHIHGCGRFFNAARHTVSDRFYTTYKAGEPKPAIVPLAAIATKLLCR